MSNFYYRRRFNLSTMLSLKAYESMSSTPKPKHTIVDKGSMKVLQRFIQIEMKKNMIMVMYFFNKDVNGINICMELNMLWI